jgi:hypothetical protein
MQPEFAFSRHTIKIYNSQLIEKNANFHSIYATPDLNDYISKLSRVYASILKRKQFEHIVFYDYSNTLTFAEKIFYICQIFEADFFIHFVSMSFAPIEKIKGTIQLEHEK